jgi:hypothetical protein
VVDRHRAQRAAHRAGQRRGLGPLIEAGTRKAQGKAGDGPPHLAGQGEDGRRVQAAAEQNPHRALAVQAEGHSLGQGRAERRRSRRRGHRPGQSVISDRPADRSPLIDFNMQRVVFVEVGLQAPAGGKPVHADEQRAVGRQVLVSQGVAQGLGAEGRGHPQREQGLGLGGDQQGPLENSVDQRFDAEAVAQGEQAPVPTIGHDEGEFSAKRSAEARALAQVEGRQQARVARAHRQALGAQLLGGRPPTIELAVQHGAQIIAQRTIIEPNRLGGADPAHHREPPVAELQPPARRRPAPLAVGPPVGQGRERQLQAERRRRAEPGHEAAHQAPIDKKALWSSAPVKAAAKSARGSGGAKRSSTGTAPLCSRRTARSKSP